MLSASWIAATTLAAGSVPETVKLEIVSNGSATLDVVEVVIPTLEGG